MQQERCYLITNTEKVRRPNGGFHPVDAVVAVLIGPADADIDALYEEYWLDMCLSASRHPTPTNFVRWLQLSCGFRSATPADCPRLAAWAPTPADATLAPTDITSLPSAVDVMMR